MTEAAREFRKDDADSADVRRSEGEGNMQVSRDRCVLHLSEHHGDCSPGSAMRIETSDLDAFHAELTSKRYKYARPGIENMPWGTRDMSVKDPFGNRLTFTTAIST
jgi:hypothetical protein